MKVSKAFVSLALAGILSSVVCAETPDEEIARLKKENELLELQKKNEELKKGKASESKKSLNVDKSGAFGFCKGEYANTGCFVGAEIGYAGSVSNYMNADIPGNYSFDTQTTYALPINVIFGWQWYFKESMGLNIKAHIGYAGYGSDIKLFDTTQNANDKLNSSTLHYGLEVSYLYDFITGPKHAFGIDVGIGYEFGTFLRQSADIGGVTESLDSYRTSSFLSRLGVHYFLNTHHQFWLHYTVKSGYTIGEGGSKSIEGTTVNYSTTPKGAFIFAYAYKF